MEDEIDLQLKQLAVEAQQHPAYSLERQKALTKLRNAIWLSGKLAYPQKRSWSPNIYEDLYNEALLKTIEYICLKIDNYDPERPLMAPVNHILKLRFKDAVKRYMKEKNRTRELPSLNDLDNYQSPQSPLSEEATMLREVIEEDPDNLFRSVSVRGRPDITWQVIALAKLEGETLDSMSQRFGVSISGIDSFFNRNLRRFGEEFRNRLQ